MRERRCRVVRQSSDHGTNRTGARLACAIGDRPTAAAALAEARAIAAAVGALPESALGRLLAVVAEEVG